MNIRLKIPQSTVGRLSLGLLILLSGTVFTINSILAAAQYEQGAEPLDKIKTSPQFVSGKFTNPIPWTERPGMGTFVDYLFGKQHRVPAQTLPQSKIDLDDLGSKDSSHLRITNAGHSSLIIQMDGYRILTDPVYEAKISPLGPTRFNRDLPLDPHAMRDVDVVVISHNHYDHLNKFTIQTIHPEVTVFIVPLGVGAQLEAWGVGRSKIVELDWWDEYDFDGQLRIVSTPSQHFSGRGLTDRNKTLWSSYVISSLEHNIYFSGDSGYFSGFKEIGAKYGPFDIAFLECGAYNPAWAFVHMFPEETVQAAVDLNAHFTWPIHWGTFNLSIHDWFDPMIRVTRAAEQQHVRVLTPIFGQVVEYPGRLTTSDWWTPYLPETEE